MKINTMLKYNFTSDIYVPRVDDAGQEVYVLLLKNTDLPMNIVSSRGQSTMFTSYAVEYGSQTLQIRNPEGTLLFVEDTANGLEEYSMYVHSVLPVVDVYGTITGYRSVLRRQEPVLTDVQSLDG